MKVKEFLPDLRGNAELRKIKGKGWNLKARRYKGTFEGYEVHVYKYRKHRDVGSYVGMKPTYMEAIHLAVSEAHKRGTLDWAKTVRWCKWQDIELTYDAIRYDARQECKGRGWYIFKSKRRIGHAYEVYVGLHSHSSSYVACTGSKRKAIQIGITASQEKGCYGEEKTILWLERNDMSDLIPTARQKKVA